MLLNFVSITMYFQNARYDLALMDYADVNL